MLKLVGIEKLFPFTRSDMQLQWNPSLSLWSSKACNSFYFASRRWSCINMWLELKKTVSSDDIVHFIGEEDIVTYEDFDCCYSFYPETSTKNRESNRERNYLSRSCEKSKHIRSNDRYNYFIDEQHNANIFLNPYSLWGMVPAALMSLNHTNDRYFIFNQYPQPTTHQPRTDSYPVFSSLRRMDSQRKGLRVSFALFQRNYLPDERIAITYHR